MTAGGNTSLDHLLFRRDGRLVTLLSPSVSSADALSDLHSKNLVNADIRVNLLGFGAYTANRKHFWSFDLNLRTSVSTQFPYELFHFFKTGESAQYAIWASVRMPMRKPGSTTRFLSARSSMSVRA